MWPFLFLTFLVPGRNDGWCLKGQWFLLGRIWTGQIKSEQREEGVVVGLSTLKVEALAFVLRRPGNMTCIGHQHRTSSAKINPPIKHVVPGFLVAYKCFHNLPYFTTCWNSESPQQHAVSLHRVKYIAGGLVGI